MVNRPLRTRRCILAVPGSSPRFIAKSRSTRVDSIFLDLEDSVAPDAKVAARDSIVDALRDDQGWLAQTVTVRVNDWTTPWTVGDITTVMAAGERVDTVILPKVTSADQVKALDLVVTQLEQQYQLPVGKIGFDLIIEDGLGVLHAGDIAAACERNETLMFGPGDYMAAMGMRQVSVGSQPDGYPADAYHHVLMSILTAARAYGLDAIEGPFVGIDDIDGLQATARRSAALGYVGKWAIHPSQIAIIEDIFSPSQQAIARAQVMIEAYEAAVNDHVGAIKLNGEMVDEAGVKVARAILAMAETNR